RTVDVERVGLGAAGAVGDVADDLDAVARRVGLRVEAPEAGERGGHALGDRAPGADAHACEPRLHCCPARSRRPGAPGRSAAPRSRVAWVRAAARSLMGTHRPGWPAPPRGCSWASPGPGCP